MAAACAAATTTVPRATDLAAFVAGVTCAEGHFSASGPRFSFAVSLGGVDRATCDLLHTFFGVGAVRVYPRRKPHYDDEAAYRVQRLGDLLVVIVPFMDEHLPPSHKRAQFENWRANLLDYWEHRAKRRRCCTVEGCDKPRRAKGYCRHHYFEVFGS